MADSFRALLVSEAADGTFERSVVERTVDDLPQGDVLIDVRYSSLNYKDALSATGNRGVTRSYPHTPGIDAAGIVLESTTDQLQPGDEVVVIGYDLGMNTSGGFGQLIRVPADWVVSLPTGLGLHESMIYGTAGWTAALAVQKLIDARVAPQDGEVLVTGATGGVGSVAVGVLAQAGYTVVAATGKATAHDFLAELGATTVISRDEVVETSARPLLKERWAGVVDTVGGDMLASALRATRYGGTVACCGNVGGAELNLTVYPFILRGISLLGIDSVRVSPAVRRNIWRKLGAEWKLPQLHTLARDVSLDELGAEIERILRGEQTGRVVVRLYEA